MGPCDVLRHNPHNAVSLLGHAQGVVTMWTPNLTSPVVKMLAHRVSCLLYLHTSAHISPRYNSQCELECMLLSVPLADQSRFC